MSDGLVILIMIIAIPILISLNFRMERILDHEAGMHNGWSNFKCPKCRRKLRNKI